MRLSTTTRLCLLPIVFALGACTAILPPDESDDSVQRCENTEECTLSEDNRLVASCVTDQTEVSGAPGVCVYDYVEIGCDPTKWGPGQTIWADVANEAAMNTSAYSAPCDTENLGKNGCDKPEGGDCDEGLEYVQFDGAFFRCVDTEAMPAIFPPSFDRAGEEVQHAFCRAFFGCDDAFVCDINLGKCVPCDPSSTDASNGGCVEMWVNGSLATAYNNLSCNDTGTIDFTQIEVGEPNPAPPMGN